MNSMNNVFKIFKNKHGHKKTNMNSCDYGIAQSNPFTLRI